MRVFTESDAKALVLADTSVVAFIHYTRPDEQDRTHFARLWYDRRGFRGQHFFADAVDYQAKVRAPKRWIEVRTC